MVLMCEPVYLAGGKVEVLPEGETQHIKVFPSIPGRNRSCFFRDLFSGRLPERCKDMAVHLPVLQVLRLHEHHS